MWFYNHRNVLNPLVDEAPMGMDVESDDEDDDVVEDEWGETEGDQLDQVSEKFLFGSVFLFFSVCIDLIVEFHLF